MPSLQETVEQQAATIQQLTDIVAKSEARHRSLERMIRWMGVGVFVLALMFAMPVKQDLFSVAHANTDPVPQQQMQCSQLPNADCAQVQQMVMAMFGQMMAEVKKELAPMLMPIFGHSQQYLDFMKQRIEKQIVGLEEALKQAQEAGKTKQAAMLSDKIDELKAIIEFGASMTLMDHIANIDYDFNNLADLGHAIPAIMEDINKVVDDVDNMSKRMDTMARDMHNMNTMAFDIHNMAATGVPVMGRMNNATSWMPWW